MRDIDTGISRRDWLVLSLAASGGIAAQRVFGAHRVLGPDSSGGLVIHNPRALDAEAPLSALATPRTPVEHFFVRSHFGPPVQLPLAWTLTIDGLVSQPATLSLDDIRALGPQSYTTTLECAGNSRGIYALPVTSGVQWAYGAVSTADWTGVPLGAVLARVGLRPSARYLWMEGQDHAPLPTVPKFLRSLPRDVALDGAYIAYEMNGRPIPLLHGGPVRLIMPGWFGMASTKWLTHIHAMPNESDNYFMRTGYRYADKRPVSVMQTKSIIVTPSADARVPPGRLTMRGQAWSGAGSGGIRGVDVSMDGGQTWSAGRLVGAEVPGAWRGWEADVAVQRGDVVLMARATDRSGNVQPMQAVPNPGGFGNNSIHRVPIHVA
ncbi:MAG TPA: sulfite oxidase [Gemmatimonadaceae bacterium]|jgi:sulfite oxidase|nr:sulfite oxidase [Gemmatimonadaceae bacterium]